MVTSPPRSKSSSSEAHAAALTRIRDAAVRVAESMPRALGLTLITGLAEAPAERVVKLAERWHLEEWMACRPSVPGSGGSVSQLERIQEPDARFGHFRDLWEWGS